MATLEDMTASPEEVTIGGDTYTVTPLPARDYGRIYKKIRELRPDYEMVAHKLAEGCTADERRRIFDRAWGEATKAKVISAGELKEYMLSIEGSAYCFWLSLQPCHPDITIERATELQQEWAASEMESLFASMKEHFPDASSEDMASVMMAHDQGVFGKLVEKISGLPRKNASGPTKETETQTDRSRGGDGSGD